MITTPRQFRLTDSDLADLDRLRDLWGLRSRADAIRQAARLCLGTQAVVATQVKKPARKSEKQQKRLDAVATIDYITGVVIETQNEKEKTMNATRETKTVSLDGTPNSLADLLIGSVTVNSDDGKNWHCVGKCRFGDGSIDLVTFPDSYTSELEARRLADDLNDPESRSAFETRCWSIAEIQSFPADDAGSHVSVGDELPIELISPDNSAVMEYIHRSIRRAGMYLSYQCEQGRYLLRVIRPVEIRLPALPALEDEPD